MWSSRTAFPSSLHHLGEFVVSELYPDHHRAVHMIYRTMAILTVLQISGYIGLQTLPSPRPCTSKKVLYLLPYTGQQVARAGHI